MWLHSLHTRVVCITIHLKFLVVIYVHFTCELIAMKIDKAMWYLKVYYFPFVITTMKTKPQKRTMSDLVANTVLLEYGNIKVDMNITAQSQFLAWSKFRLCWANHRAGYFSTLACDWLSIVWAYSMICWWSVLNIVNDRYFSLSDYEIRKFNFFSLINIMKYHAYLF